MFAFTEPLIGWRHLVVTDQRTKSDWAEAVRQLVDIHRPQAKRITLVMDNLNTHSLGSLYEAFPPEEARRLIRRLEVVHTPKHGSWLNMAEIELNVLTRQCLARGSLTNKRSPMKPLLGKTNETAVRQQSIGSSPPKMLEQN